MYSLVKARTTGTYKYYGVILTFLGYFISFHLFHYIPILAVVFSALPTIIFIHSHFFFLNLTHEELRLQVGKLVIFKTNLEDITDLDDVVVRSCPFDEDEISVFKFRIILNNNRAYTIKSCFLQPRFVMIIIQLINKYTLGKNSEETKQILN